MSLAIATKNNNLIKDYLTHHPPQYIPWLAPWQAQQHALFKKESLPTPKSEAYRHTPLPKLLTPLHSPSSLSSPPLVNPIETLSSNRDHQEITPDYHLYSHLQRDKTPPVFKRFSACSPTQQHRLQTYLKNHSAKDPLFTLNTALFTDGLWLDIPAHTHYTLPLSLDHLFTESALSFRNPHFLITLGENAHLTLVERYHANQPASFWANPIQQILLAKNAQLTHYQLHTQPQAPQHFTPQTFVTQETQSQYTHYLIAHQGKTLRHNLQVTLAAPHSQCRAYGLYHGQDRQHIELHTQILHQAPHTQSQTSYRGLTQDRSKALFYGKIIVPQTAHHTQAHQLHKGWILSPKSSLYAHPQLQIHNPQIQCTHGSTLQKENPTALRYLQSRGIPTTTARNLLLSAFCQTLLDQFTLPQLASQIQQQLPFYKLHA